MWALSVRLWLNNKMLVSLYWEDSCILSVKQAKESSEGSTVFTVWTYHHLHITCPVAKETSAKSPLLGCVSLKLRVKQVFSLYFTQTQVFCLLGVFESLSWYWSMRTSLHKYMNLFVDEWMTLFKKKAGSLSLFILSCHMVPSVMMPQEGP